MYGGGGNSGAVYTNDFVELFNRGDTPADLSGWSVQYANATGTSWQVTPLSGSLAPGRYYLIRQAAGSGGTQGLPAPDASGETALAATAGKVALVRHTTALAGSCPAGVGLVDFVGYGASAACFEGSGRAAAPSNTTAVHRRSGGCADTGDNAADFQTGPPDPRHTASPARACQPDQSANAGPGGVSPVLLFVLGIDVDGDAFSRAPAAGVSLSAPRPTGGSTRWRRGASASGPRGRRAARPRPRGASP